MKIRRVLVRDVEGQPLVRMVCKATETAVFVASAAALLRMEAGDQNCWPVGFRRECVFNYDGQPLPRHIEWEKMTPWIE